MIGFGENITEAITIKRGETVLAHHTADHPYSENGSLVWSVLVGKPEPGPATLTMGDKRFEIEILNVTYRWLNARRDDGYLVGILWCDGDYYSDFMVDENDNPIRSLSEGHYIRNSLPRNGFWEIRNLWDFPFVGLELDKDRPYPGHLILYVSRT